MSFLNSITRLIEDPEPQYVFEISEGGIAYIRPESGRQPTFEPLPNDVLSVSPLRDNILRPEAFANKVASLVGGATRKRRRSVLILPDFCARVAVLDFDKFPDKPEEQASLVRFRMKKSVPFDIEDAAISYHPQNSGKGRIDLVVAAVSLEIVAKYEAPFRSAGLHTGIVTTSALATADLERNTGLSLLSKLSGKTLTISLFYNRVLKLVRCVELSQLTEDEVLAVIYPTIAYVEDEYAAKPDRIELCGFDALPGLRQDELASRWQAEIGVPVSQLRSGIGTPNQHNSGLLGYLEAARPSKMRAEAVPA